MDSLKDNCLALCQKICGDSVEGRKPCPVDENGIPFIPADLAICYDTCLKGVKTTNRHHLLHPRAEYKNLFERSARELGVMVVKACVCRHSDYHSTYLPPHKPSRQTLIDISQCDIKPQVANVYIRSREDE